MWDIVTDANSGVTDVMDLLRDPSDSLPSHVENSLVRTRPPLLPCWML
jgi:hypothetical protein